jgi:very-short-patch-repair endonuclease
VQFRRQVIIGRYVVDLVAPATRLVVEIDGSFHATRVRDEAAASAQRDS